MTPDTEGYRRKLEHLAAVLAQDIEAEDLTRESIVPDCAIGGISRMEAIQAQAVGNESRRRMAARLEQVRNALARIERGTFGHCARCGKPIAKARLIAAPEAPRCVACSGGE